MTKFFLALKQYIQRRALYIYYRRGNHTSYVVPATIISVSVL